MAAGGREGRSHRGGLGTESVLKDKLSDRVGEEEGKEVGKMDPSEKASHGSQGAGPDKARGPEEW